jgi:hypothetical protein
MKKQLTKCRTGQLKQFGYGSILVSFFLERVPILHLQHLEWGIPTPSDPRMKRWGDLMARHGGVPIVTYDQSFFKWLRNQLFMVEDYELLGPTSMETSTWNYLRVLSGER